jgi:hypothetical protein
MARKVALAVVVLLALGLLSPTAGVAAPPRNAERWALVIGIDRFQGRTTPNVGSAGDARDLTQVLKDSGWPDDHIVTLTDGAATAANIREGLKWLVSHASDRSFAVFHYSGHTKQIGGDRDRDGEALDEYLWPHDNQFIADGEVAHYLRQLRGWAWINFSACEAAGFDDGVSSERRLVTASSQENEKSYEHPDWKNSIHTGLMVDQGIRGGDADANRDTFVSIDEAFAFSADRAPTITSRQRTGPQHPYRAGGDGTEWFLKPPPEPEPPAPERSCILGICI